MITINSENIQITLTVQDKQFVDMINNRITIYGQIPYTVPSKLIVDVIRDSARMFYRMGYYKSQQTAFYLLNKSEILKLSQDGNEQLNPIATDPTFANNNNFKGYVIQLPGFINNVKEIYETNKESSTSIELIANIQGTQRSSPYGSSIAGINSSLYMIEAVTRLIQEQNIRSILGEAIPFNYNTATKTLMIFKEVKKNHLLKTICNVDIKYLYNDDLFIRHVIGRTKQELKRLIASHTIQLPGDATLNADEICNNLEDVEKVEDILKNAGGIGDLILMRD